MGKWDTVIVTKSYVSKVVIDESQTEPALLSLGAGSVGKAIGFQDGWVWVNIEQFVPDYSQYAHVYDMSYGRQYAIPKEHLAQIIEGTCQK